MLFSEHSTAVTYLPYTPPFNSGATVGNPSKNKAPPTIPKISGQENPPSTQPSLNDTLTSMLEEHLFKQKPTQQTYIGPGLPTLPA